ncbi:MAG: formate dehydrogenase subunit gamma [Solirubrobacteraceae bacterium]|jgi:formate dehydrogenase subunit gamma|nr:formate dehydrogenase subunit gamma [Solirubrobacteraceae bacterium]
MADSRRLVQRFGRTERALHQVHATAFILMLATGLILYAPPLSRIFADRPVIKGIHLVVAVAWVTALLIVIVVGDRKQLGATRRQLERFDDEDTLFLKRKRLREPRPGRFNGGQKLHAAIQAGIFVLAYVSGTLLWLAEHNTAFRLGGTIAVHDFCTLLGLVLLLGHVYKTIGAQGSLDGIVRGTVTESYAQHHHPRWEAPAPRLTVARVQLGALLAGVAIAGAGVALAILTV